MRSPKHRTHRQPRVRAGSLNEHERRQSSTGTTVRDNRDIVPAWSFRDSLTIHLSRVPAEATVLSIWEAFSAHGRIISIDLFEDSTGKRTHNGKLRFKYCFLWKKWRHVVLILIFVQRPPPETAFWTTGRYPIKLPNGREVSISLQPEVQRHNYQVPSPVHSDFAYPAEIVRFTTFVDKCLLNSNLCRTFLSVASTSAH